jgi:hypothetical protein
MLEAAVATVGNEYIAVAKNIIEGEETNYTGIYRNRRIPAGNHPETECCLYFLRWQLQLYPHDVAPRLRME